MFRQGHATRVTSHACLPELLDLRSLFACVALAQKVGVGGKCRQGHDGGFNEERTPEQLKGEGG
jgi:hypothetical protein